MTSYYTIEPARTTVSLDHQTKLSYFKFNNKFKINILIKIKGEIKVICVSCFFKMSNKPI